MEEKKMPTELSEMELESVDGGAAVHNGHRITTALTSSKNCPYYDEGSNFYNKKLLAFKGYLQRLHEPDERGWLAPVQKRETTKKIMGLKAMCVRHIS